MKSHHIFFTILAVIASFSFVRAQSTAEFINNTDTLVVYKDVPGLAPSDKYTIRVRSAATNNEWVDVFANFTYNKADPALTTLNSPDMYQVNCAAWSHAYGNIEMNIGQTVEVEIAAKSGFKIGGQDFFKATVHPAQKASAATLVGGKVYFTITKPGQIYIDINGQMDDYNKAINPIGHPVHVVTLFANPIIKKPTLTGNRVRTIDPGTSLSTINGIDPATYDTMYFKPGLHDIASGIKMHPGKTIYIPGDAYIFGTFNNRGVPSGIYTKNGEGITIYGYGTICGAKVPHYQVSPDVLAVLYPGVVVDGDKTIIIENDVNCKVFGITLADNANHSIEINGGSSKLNWVKTVSWRVNGDGLGGYSDAEDCFIRSHDDCSYVKSNKRRCTFWKDSNARLFYMATIPTNRQIIIEDCDVLYARLRSNPGTNGGGFTSDGGSNVNVIIRNIRFHDKLINMRVFNHVTSETTGHLSGVLYQNISIAGMATGNKQRLIGTATSPYNGGITFDNVTIGGTLLTSANLSTYFETNQYVNNIVFNPIKTNQTITFPEIAAKVYGDADFNPGATASSGLTVTYTSSNTTVATIVSGNIHIVGVGTSIITASQEGDAYFNAATPVVQTLTVNETPTLNPFSQIEAENYYSMLGVQTQACSEGGLQVAYIQNGDYVMFNNVNFGTGATSFEARVSCGSVGGSIEIRLGSPTGTLVGTCAITGTGSWTTYTTNSCAISGATGTQNLYLVFTGGTGYLFNINWFKFIAGVLTKQDQTITFPVIDAKTFGDADFNPGASASSGLAVTYTSSNSDVAAIVSGNIHIIGAGTSDITASQIGNANYNAATPVVQTLTINKANQSITFPAIAAKTVGEVDFSPGATASSGLAVIYTSSDLAVATIVGSNIHLVGAGTATITASQSGDATYNAAPSVVQPLTVNPSQTIPEVTTLSGWVSGTTNNKVAGSNRLMTVMVMGESNANFAANAVTYGGQTMVKQSEKMYYVKTNRTYSSIFTLNESGVNAATSGTIAVNWSATPTVGSSIYSVLLSNVDQTTPVSATANNGLTGTSITTSALAANTGDMVVMCGATENNITQTFNNGFTKQFESNSGWGDGVGGYKMGTGVSETPKFTQSARGLMALCAVVVKKATTAMRAPSKNTNVIDITNTSKNSISIYPNPVSTNLNIDFSNADISRDVKVFNVFGQLVYSTKTKDTNIQINVQSLNLKGLVMVQILEGKTVVNHKVLVK